MFHTVKKTRSVKDNIAYGTYAGYKQVLESRIIPYFKGDKIAHIKTPHIEAFYRTLVDDYSAGTIKRFANVLNLIFKTAKRYSMIENNPCQDAQKPKRKDEDEGLKFFTPKQALMFMKSLDMSYEVTYKGHQRIDDTGKPYYVNEYTESYAFLIVASVASSFSTTALAASSASAYALQPSSMYRFSCASSGD